MPTVKLTWKGESLWGPPTLDKELQVIKECWAEEIAFPKNVPMTQLVIQYQVVIPEIIHIQVTLII